MNDDGLTRDTGSKQNIYMLKFNAQNSSVLFLNITTPIKATDYNGSIINQNDLLSKVVIMRGDQLKFANQYKVTLFSGTESFESKDHAYVENGHRLVWST